MADGSDSELDPSSECSGSEPVEISAEVYTDKAQFLNDIHSKFLDLVHPIESGLMDEFRAHGAMSSDEEHLIRAETTRRDKARKMWKLLRLTPAEVFEKSCYPAISEKYSHVLEGKQFCWNGQGGTKIQCLRHLIMRSIRLKRFGDLFPPEDGCTEEEYRIITESGDSSSSWDVAFTLCAKLTNKNNVSFGEKLRRFLANSGVEIPENFAHMLAKSFPCTCHFQPPTPRDKPKKTSQATLNSGNVQPGSKRGLDVSIGKDVGSMTKHLSPTSAKQYRMSSCGYPSTMDDLSEERCSVSISSQETKDAVMAEADEDEQELKFDTKADKAKFLEEMQKLNTAIKSASNVRPLFRELDGIREEIRILSTVATLETSRHVHDVTEIKRLCKRAKEMYRTLLRDFQAASGVKGKINHMINSEHKKILKRRQMLVNEMNEAALFVDKAKTVYMDSRQVLQSVDRSMKYTSLSEYRLQDTYSSPLFRGTTILFAKTSNLQQRKRVNTQEKKKSRVIFFLPSICS